MFTKMIKFNYKIDCNIRLQLLLNKKKITAYFENLTVELVVLYTLNTHVNFCINWMLFTI